MKKTLINAFKHNLMQFRWGRKMIGGKFYYLWPLGLPINPFWSDTLVTSCQTIIIKTEEYNEKAGR